MASGWYYPSGSSATCGYRDWGPSPGGFHLAQDFCRPTGQPVYSVGTGEVVLSNPAVNGYGRPDQFGNPTPGGALVARYQASDGTYFTALYGHLNNLHSVGPVSAGEIIGYTNSIDNPHVHFGVHPGFSVGSEPYRGYGTATNTYGFVDPLPYLNAHPNETENSYTLTVTING